MFKSISAIAALLFAAAILYAGNGLQSTLLSVRGDLEGFPTAIIGLLASAYYAGLSVHGAAGRQHAPASWQRSCSR